MMLRFKPQAGLPRTILILMYHHLEPNHPARTPYSISLLQFERQVMALRNARYETVSFQRLSRALKEETTLPAKSLLITFDDGYKSFFNLAMPVLQAQGMTATAFIVAGEIGGFNRWDEDKGIPHRALMTEEELRAVVDAGFELGSHGWSHRDLLACSPAETEEEIVRARQFLQARFGAPVSAFAYPYGRHCAALYESLAGAGFESAVIASTVPPREEGNPFAMPRVLVQQRDNGMRFRLKLSPLYRRYKKWRGMLTHFALYGPERAGLRSF